MSKEDRYANGYKLIYNPEHPRAYKTGPHIGYVYEHIQVAEEMMNRPLTEKEVTHHLNQKRDDNKPSNLLVLERSQHTKLHNWMNKQIIVPNPLKVFDKKCEICGAPLISGQEKYCSSVCSKTASRVVTRPTKEQLTTDVQQLPMTNIGKKYGVSDNAIRKWCKSEDITVPKREPGFWTKVKCGLIPDPSKPVTVTE